MGRTPDAAGGSAAACRELDVRQPHGLLVTAEEVAASTLSRADPGSGSTSGTVLPVGGGMHDLLRPVD